MSITLISGKPGAGKSYHAVGVVIDSLSSGKEVWTNIEGLNLGLIAGSHNIHLMNEQELSEPWACVPENVVLVFDEVLGFFSRSIVGTGQGKASPSFLKLEEWLRMHRHSGQELYFVCQDLRLLAQPLRLYGSIIWWFENMGHLGFKHSFSVKHYSKADDAIRGMRPYYEAKGKYDLKRFDLYKSVNQGAAVVHNEGKNLFLRPVFFVPLLVGLLGAVLFYDKLSIFHRHDVEVAQAAVVAEHLPKKPTLKAIPAVTPALPTDTAKSQALGRQFMSAQESAFHIVGITLMGKKCIISFASPDHSKDVFASDRSDWYCMPGVLFIKKSDRVHTYRLGDTVTL